MDGTLDVRWWYTAFWPLRSARRILDKVSHIHGLSYKLIMILSSYIYAPCKYMRVLETMKVGSRDVLLYFMHR